MNIRPNAPIMSRFDPGLRALFDLAEHLVNGRSMPEVSRRVVSDVINVGIASGFSVEFYQALGLRRWGGISPLKKFRLDRRDRILCRLKQAVPEWADLAPTVASKIMAASASRYEATRWPREQHNAIGPTAQPFQTWWSILRGGLKLPGQRRLAQILASEIQEHFEFPDTLISLPGKEERSTMPDRPTSPPTPIDATLDQLERLAATVIPAMPAPIAEILKQVDRLMPAKPGANPIDAATIVAMLRGSSDD